MVLDPLNVRPGFFLRLLMQAVSMLLLGGITGAVSNVLSCYRNYLCYKVKLHLVWKTLSITASIVMLWC